MPEEGPKAPGVASTVIEKDEDEDEKVGAKYRGKAREWNQTQLA